jgi:hypothetical protein
MACRDMLQFDLYIQNPESKLKNVRSKLSMEKDKMSRKLKLVLLI